jgi:hypothetical protein
MHRTPEKMTPKKYRYLALSIVILLLSGWNIPRTFAQPEFIRFNHLEKDGQKRYPPVTFSHESHMEEIECLTCHHDYKDGENVLDEDDLEEGNSAATCTACHSMENCDDIQKTFHGLCMGCHIRSRKEGLPHGPRLCVECHVPIPEKQ